ncbi:uncharacterized protein LOC122247487 [Penaeus japonicus]|uniref:uncharacterized protein LOC122247487 n=1 Tax=Penaeus japonicus TaxID=27405 RepID=UPI001C71324A|nr:uncharacterized protein LOC122247487 [Penaeus japonicus]
MASLTSSLPPAPTANGMTSQASNAELRALVEAGDAEGLQTALGSLSAGISTFLGYANVSGWTPLHWASWNGHHAVAGTLSRKGGEVNLPEAFEKVNVSDSGIETNVNVKWLMNEDDEKMSNVIWKDLMTVLHCRDTWSLSHARLRKTSSLTKYV